MNIIERLRKLLDEATPGPWCVYGPTNQPTINQHHEESDDECERCVIVGVRDAEHLAARGQDLALCAAARNALPALLDRLEAAEAALARHDDLAATTAPIHLWRENVWPSLEKWRAAVEASEKEERIGHDGSA